MNYRILGKTDLSVSEVGFGGIPILRLPEKEAVKILRYAFDQGINFFDSANAYKDSEYKMGAAFTGIRSKVIIATKTFLRDGKGAEAQLENSLKMLQTDYIDLYQLHQVSQEKDWQAITAPDGALEVLVKAKKSGKIRHMGVTSHNVSMAIRLVKTGLFETIQFPFNFIEEAPKDDLFIEARKLNLGIIAMKPFGGGAIDNAGLAFKFLRQYPDIIPIPGFDSIQTAEEVIDLYKKPNVISEQDITLMEQYKKELGQKFCRRCEYCQPCPFNVKITPAMGYPILVKRMSEEVAANFARGAMDSIPLCTQCGACIKKCPYNLPIPEILSANYKLYKGHN